MVPPDVEISDFTCRDQEAVKALVLGGLSEHWGTLQAGLNRDLDDIASSYADGRTIVIRTSDGTLVGTGTLARGEDAVAEIVRMSVARDQRRQGTGRILVEELVATASAWGASQVILETSSAWDEVVAFYRSCGFTITHRIGWGLRDDTWFARDVVR